MSHKTLPTSPQRGAEVQQLSPAGIQALITRFREGLIRPEEFINGLAAQDVILSAEVANALLEAGVITPEQFELVSGRNTQRLAGSQGFFAKTQNVFEGIAQDAGLVGRAGTSRKDQALKAALLALSLLPVGGVAAGAIRGGAAVRAIPGAASLLKLRRIPVPFRRGRKDFASILDLLSPVGVAGVGVTQILESDKAQAAQFEQQRQGVDIRTSVDDAQGVPAVEGLDEEGIRKLFEDIEAAEGAEKPDVEGDVGEELPPFEFLEIPGLGKLVRIREEIRDDFGVVLGFKFGEPIRVPEEEEARPSLDSATILAISEALADPATALTLQAGFTRLINQAEPGTLDQTTLAIGQLLGIKPGQTNVNVGGLPASVLSAFGITDGTAPVAGTTKRRDVVVPDPEFSSSRAGIETLSSRVSGLPISEIPNLNALSPREINALQALATVQGINFSDIQRQSKLVTPPSGQRRRATVNR